MTLEGQIAQTFKDNNWTWNLKGSTIVPDEEDITNTLDEAARLLYDEPVDTQLEIGRLIIVKTPRAHDVYVFAGEYQ